MVGSSFEIETFLNDNDVPQHKETWDQKSVAKRRSHLSRATAARFSGTCWQTRKKDGFVVSLRPCVFFSFKKFLFWPGVFKRTGALRVLSHNPGMAFSQSFNIRLWSKEKKYQTPLKEKKGSRTLKQPMPVCPWADSFPSGLKGYSLLFFLASGKIRFVCYSICRAAALQGFMISSAIDLEASFVERICMTSYPNFFSTWKWRSLWF